MVQQVNPSPAKQVFCVSLLVKVLAALLQIQDPASASGKAAADDPSMWAPATQLGDLDTLPGS